MMADAELKESSDKTTPQQVGRYRVGTVSHVIPSGSLLSEEQQQHLAEALQTCVDNRESQVVIDFSSVTHVNSKNLELLLHFQGRFNRLGGWLKLTHCNPLIRDILHLTRIDQSIQIIERDGSSPAVRTAAIPGKVRIGDLLIENELLSESRVEEAIEI